jgi:hypothetical protein
MRKGFLAGARCGSRVAGDDGDRGVEKVIEKVVHVVHAPRSAPRSLRRDSLCPLNVVELVRKPVVHFGSR